MGHLVDNEYFHKYTVNSNLGWKQFLLIDHNYIPITKRIPSYMFYTLGLKDQYLGFAHSFYTILFISLCSYCFTRESFSSLVPSSLIRFIVSLTFSSLATLDTMLMIHINYYFCIPLALYLIASLHNSESSTPLFIKIASPLFIISQPLLVSLFPAFLYCAFQNRRKKSMESKWMLFSIFSIIPFYVFYIFYILFVKVSVNQELKSLSLDSTFLLFKKVLLNISFHYSRIFSTSSDFYDLSAVFITSLIIGIGLKIYLIYYSMKTKDKFLKYSLQVATSMIAFSSFIAISFFPWGIEVFFPYFDVTEKYHFIQEVGILIIIFSLIISMTKKFSPIVTVLSILLIGSIGSFRYLPQRWYSPSHSFKHISLNTKVNRHFNPIPKSCFSGYRGSLMCYNIRLLVKLNKYKMPETELSKIQDDGSFKQVQVKFKPKILQANKWKKISYNLVSDKFSLYGLRLTMIVSGKEYKNIGLHIKFKGHSIKKKIIVPHKKMEFIQIYYQFPEEIKREDLSTLSMKIDKEISTYLKNDEVIVEWAGTEK